MSRRRESAISPWQHLGEAERDALSVLLVLFTFFGVLAGLDYFDPLSASGWVP